MIPVEEARRLRALNYARQKGMVSDAKKLLKLTTELNAEIAVAELQVMLTRPAPKAGPD